MVVDVKNWEDEWVDMPEFIQEKQEPYKKITIRFETEEDYKNFANLIKQNLTLKTKSIWFPYKPHVNEYESRWRDEP